MPTRNTEHPLQQHIMYVLFQSTYQTKQESLLFQKTIIISPTATATLHHSSFFSPPRRRTSHQVLSIFQPVAPFVFQASVSMAAYAAGLTVAQGLGSALRISCATPIAGPLGGLLGVGFASALAGQASLNCHRIQVEGFQRGGGISPISLLRDMRAEDLIADAVLGIAAFRVMGGRFRSVMPSDLTRVGAIARESMPAAGINYATDEKRRELFRFFKRDGCHHCGTRKGHVVGDHMPPNKHVKEIMNASKTRFMGGAMKSKYVQRAMTALGLPTGQPVQRYFPQCRDCCQKQSAAVRNGRSHLVFHEVLHRGGSSSSWHYAGVLVGLRHQRTKSTPSSTSSSSSSNNNKNSSRYYS